MNRFYVDAERPFHPTVPDPGMVRSLRALVRKRRPHVVHAHSWMVHSLLPFLPSPQTRLVVTMHDYGLVCPKNTFVYKDGVCDGPHFAKCIACASEQYGRFRSAALTSGLSLMRPWHRRVDRFIAVSAPVARACSSLSARDGPPIEVIPPFLPDDSFPPPGAKRPAFVPATGEYLMFAGALGAHKGIDVLLEAWAALGPEIALVLAGLPSPDAPRRFPRRQRRNKCSARRGGSRLGKLLHRRCTVSLAGSISSRRARGHGSGPACGGLCGGWPSGPYR